uniref:endonuclease domain-containing protein n=1 Tax=Klebsiella pneumoniae TaxID=573 RepID=UPI001F4B764F
TAYACSLGLVGSEIGIRDRRYVAEAAATCGLLAENEYRAIPGRCFRLDVAVPSLKLGFECDGWQYHAKHLEAWRKEKERDRLFLQHGWQVYRFAASEILSGAAKAEIARIVGEAKGKGSGTCLD